MGSLLWLSLLAIATTSLFAQTNSGDLSGRARVYVTDSKSWEIGGAGGGTAGGLARSAAAATGPKPPRSSKPSASAALM